ncbi:MAG: hypothetical protein KDD67_05460 [Ignavibacteriae bacterium]|nr:hypothetical protein [Ignavibacteriota bacterium]MCB9216227.1 hypothetical protein [Ignavibacteria bacterium]
MSGDLSLSDRWFLKKSFLILLAICSLLYWGCEEKGGDSPGASDTAAAEGKVPSDSSGVTKAPIGKTELPTWNTAAPNLFIDLPKGFAIRSDSGMKVDRIVIYRTGDSALKDLNRPPLGVLQIVLSDSSIGTTIPAKKIRTLNRLIGSYPATWHQYVDMTLGPSVYLMNVLEIPDFFVSLGPDSDAKDLKLWIYVAGTDSATVISLLRAAETLSIIP